MSTRCALAFLLQLQHTIAAAKLNFSRLQILDEIVLQLTTAQLATEAAVITVFSLATEQTTALATMGTLSLEVHVSQSTRVRRAMVAVSIYAFHQELTIMHHVSATQAMRWHQTIRRALWSTTSVN